MTSVALAFEDRLATITLDRPARLNAFDLDLAAQLRQRIAEVARSDAEALILTGAGRAFSAGGDVQAMATSGRPDDYLRRLTDDIHAALVALHELDIPVIARVNGAVAGGGLGLMLAADVAVASHGASFTAAYAAIGLSPDCGVSFLLPSVVGAARARAFLLAGVRLDAASALDWGLVTAAVPDLELDDAVAGVAQRARRAGREALSTTRRLLVDVNVYRARLAVEAEEICALAAGSAAARIAGFAERGGGG